MDRVTTIGPKAGDRVLYKLTHADALCIAERRKHTGRQGNTAREGQVFPALVVQVWGEAAGSCVNLQVFLDGEDSHWVTSREQQELQAGRWVYPVE